MFVIIGWTNSGKTTVANILEKDYGYKRTVTYTTRPKRPGEIDGVDYNFISKESFLSLKEKGFFAETAGYDTCYGTWYYGSSKESYSDDNSFIILNPKGLKQIREAGLNPQVYMLRVPASALLKRGLLRGDNEDELRRRLDADCSDFKGITDCYNIYCVAQDPSAIARIIHVNETRYPRKKPFPRIPYRLAQDFMDETYKHLDNNGIDEPEI